MRPAPAILHRFPIRVVVPLLLVFFSLLLVVGSLLLAKRDTSHRVEAEASERLLQRMVRLQDTLGYLASIGDMARVQAEVSALGTDPNLDLALLIDDEGTVIAANRIADIGSQAADLLHGGTEGIEQNPETLRTIARGAQGRVELLGENEIRAVFPILLVPELDQLHPERRGLLILQRSLASEKAGPQSELTRNAVTLGAASIILAGLLAILLHFLFNRRVQSLISVTRRFSEGDLEARARLPGHDELAIVGAAFDTMADRLTAGITDRRQVEERLHDLLDLNQKLVGATNLGILAYRADGPCVLANKAAARIIGGTVQQARSMNFHHIQSWKASGLLAAAEKTLADGRSRELETHFVTTFVREVSLRCRFSRFESKGKMHLLLLMSDVTERRLAEAELGLRSAALEAAANTVIITDQDGIICWVNRAFTSLTGYTADEVIGKNPRLLNSGVHDAEFYRQMYETILGGSVWRGEIVNRYKDGRLGHEESTITPLRGDDGTITHFIAIKEDITERRLAKKALIESEEKFRAIFQGAMDGIVLADPDSGQLSDANPRFCEMLGYEAEEVSNISMRHIHPANELPRSVELFKAAATGNRVEAKKVSVLRKDGSLFDAEVIGTPIEISGKRYLLGMFRDISDRLQKEVALREKAVAEEANLAKSLFLANMSHELRTPLNAIIGYAEMLTEDSSPDLSVETHEDLKKIRTAGLHLASLIDDILNLSKIEAGKIELAPERFSVAALVEDVAVTVAPLTDKNGNVLHVDCRQDIGDAFTDPTRLRQVLFNLLSNAAKFTSDGRIDLNSSRQSGKQNRDTLIFTVHDTGIGMSEDEVRRLFEPFMQADASTFRKYQGTGLGLAISRRIAELLGGELTVRSQPGNGSVFTFSLPVRLPGAQPPDSVV